MQNFIAKIKKTGLYGLAVIGIIAVVWSIFGSAFFKFKSLSAPQLGIRESGVISNSSSQDFLRSDKSAQESNLGGLSQRKVVKNGSLSLLVKKAEEAAENIKSLTERFEGFVGYSRIYEVSNGVKSGTITIRVPAKNFEKAMDEIKEFAVKVESESVNAQDVTERFIDLESQLKNFRAEEKQYLEIMKRAYTVEDTLKVAQRLSDIRGRIERVQGQFKYLSNQIDMSAITVLLTAEAEIEVFGIQWRPLFIIKQSLRGLISGLAGYINAMIAFIFHLPIILLWLATAGFIALAGWRLINRAKRKFFKC